MIFIEVSWMISVSTAQYGILLMKFWNDTQINFWGDIFSKRPRIYITLVLPRQCFLGCYFPQRELPKIYRNVHRRPIGHTKNCQFLRHRYGRNLVHVFLQSDLPDDSRPFSALVGDHIFTISKQVTRRIARCSSTGHFSIAISFRSHYACLEKSCIKSRGNIYIHLVTGPYSCPHVSLLERN